FSGWCRASLLHRQLYLLLLLRSLRSSFFLSFVVQVMEYIEHELKTLLDEKPEFSTAERKCLLYQLLEALAYMHSNFVFHRDLKPSNLLYSNKGVRKK
ncbi:cell-cycle-associated protein kinase cdk, partial [Cystoisospora suis]